MVFNSFAHFASFGGFGPKQDDDKDSRREFPAPAVPAALPEEEMSAEYPSIPEPEDKEIRGECLVSHLLVKTKISTRPQAQDMLPTDATCKTVTATAVTKMCFNNSVDDSLHADNLDKKKEEDDVEVPTPTTIDADEKNANSADTLGKNLQLHPEHSEREEFRERSNLKREATSILRRRRTSDQSVIDQRGESALTNASESAQMNKIKVVDDKRSMLKRQGRVFLGRKFPKKIFRHTATALESDEIEIIDEKKDPCLKNFRWWHAIFFFSIVGLLACLLQLVLPPPYGLMMTSAEVAELGVASGCDDDLERCVCPRETICATDKLSIILLALARCSVFFDYPLYMMMFISKAHNLNNHLRRTFVREWIDFGDMHTVHKIFGLVVGIETMSHSFFHLLRWSLNNELSLLWQSTAGVTGFIAAFVTPLICWPMVVPFLKRRISFEVRKGLHYLFIVWAVALLFHAPSRIPWLIGIPALVYVSDHMFGYSMKNNLVETAYFERYGENGVALHFDNPKSWENRSPTSFVLIMCPWISKYQWHAFTMFPDPSKENHSMLCIASSGDWTKKLHDKIQAPCLRQLYVHGPFITEFSDTAVSTSNAIAVASGIGITPTLSLVMNYAGRKRINIIWGCRDPGLIEFILHKVDMSAITRNSFAFIFYTGKRELALPADLPVNIFIFESRPDLENTITGIITAIHSGEGLPEDLYEKQQKIANIPFRKRLMIAMSRVTQIYDEDEMFAYAVKETQKDAVKMQDKGNDLESGRCCNSDLECPIAVAIPIDQVSLVGLEAMISNFLGVIGDYSRDDIKSIFDIIDMDGSTFIDRGEFRAFLKLATTEINRRSYKDLLSSMVGVTDLEVSLSSSMQKPVGLLSDLSSSHHSRGSLLNSVRSSHQSNKTVSPFGDGDSDNIEYVKRLMDDSSGEKPLEDWSIFYCGGSNAIVKNLREISKRYDIDLAVEKFDW
ncbi:hypothetical protein ACHAWT_001766 [Skeletonema menzelii]